LSSGKALGPTNAIMPENVLMRKTEIILSREEPQDSSLSILLKFYVEGRE